MAESKGKEKEPINIVHQNAIFCETILKEQRHQKLYTSYGVNPFKKSNHYLFCSLINVTSLYLVYVLAGKPNSQHDSADGDEDSKSHSFYTLSIHFTHLHIHFTYYVSI